MTKFNTGNPVGSSDPRDLYDNASVADNLVTGEKPAYNDRLGKSRKSWQGIESEFAAFIAAGGYVGTGPDGAVENYAAGIEIAGYNQIVRDSSGEFWRLSGPVALPYTTTGAGLPEGGAFVAVGDAALRQQLAANSAGNGSDAVAHRGTTETVTEALNKRTIYVGSVADLKALSLPAGTQISLTDDQSGRGGTFLVKAGVMPEDAFEAIYIAMNNGSYAVRQFGQAVIRWPTIRMEWFGYDLTGVADGTARYQAAIDRLGGQPGSVKFGLPGTTIRTTGPVYLRGSYQKIDYGEGTIHKHEGANAAITVDPALTLVNYCHIKGECLFRIDAANGQAVDFTKMSYSTIESTISVRLGTSLGAIGFYAQGNGAGTGPYYNNIGAGIIYGENASGQKAIVLKPAPGFAGTGDGPNGNNFTNVKRLAAVQTGVDVQSGNGNLFATMQTEAISNYLFEFNNRAADFTGTATAGTAQQLTDTAASFEGLAGGCLVITGGTNAGESVDIRSNTGTVLTLDRQLPSPIDSTSVYEVYASRAMGNKIINLRAEGQATAKIAKFRPGARLNKMQSMHLTSMSGVYYEDETGGFSNTVGDEFFTLEFYGSDLAAAATTNLSPLRTSFEGGIAVPFSCIVEGLVVTANRHTGGSANIKLYVAGSERKTWANVLTDSRLVSAVIRDGAPTSGVNLLTTGQQVGLDVVTDASWAASNADVHVQVLCRRLQ